MQRATVVSIAFGLLVACDSKPADTPKAKEGPVAVAEEPKAEPQPEPEPKPEPEPQPEPQPNATVAIASVQMIQDCPEQDPKPASAATETLTPKADMEAPAMGVRPRPAKGSVSGPGFAPMRQPCTQSTVQLAFASTGDTAATKIAAVRLYSTDAPEPLTPLEARLPMRWAEGNV